MLEIKNGYVYDLKESVIACRNAMKLEPSDYSEKEFSESLKRAIKLAKAGGGSGHSNFRKGIRVSFDLKYSQYITKQFQRYSFFDYVASTSMMHKLIARSVEDSCNKYVTKRTIRVLEHYINLYNKVNEQGTDEKYAKNPLVLKLRGNEEVVCHTKQDALYYIYMMCISNAPMGYELWVRVSTNYEQLATIYRQRKNHKLKEDWGAFCEWIETLPYAKELIICE